MGLDASDIEIIKATWLNVRRDNVSSGCLLFKELFTRFPQYLQLFPQFSDLDLENMRENKRLLKHAVKVIDTVSFVVDALGDDKQTATLNDALSNLVKSHLKRDIGLEKFQNLGVVLIDFVCMLNQSTRHEPSASPAELENNTGAAQNHLTTDTKSLRSAWAKLYDIILNLVRQQEGATV